jgi:hypothetical protein
LRSKTLLLPCSPHSACALSGFDWLQAGEFVDLEDDMLAGAYDEFEVEE